MPWRFLIMFALLVAFMVTLSACLPDDASPDEINPVTPPDTTSGDDDDDDDPPEPTGPWRSMPTNGFSVEAPSFYHIMFPVMNDSGSGVPDLSLADFQILEDGIEVPASEAPRVLRRRSDIPYSIYTVLCIDNSLSLAGDLAEVKSAAQTLVDARLPDQAMAIIEFSEEYSVLQEFTTDHGLLTAAIDAVSPGFGGTNLFGAMREGLEMWDDVYDVTGIEQGFMIVLTDGVDTAGRLTQSVLIDEYRKSKRVFTLGLGDGVDEASLDVLGNSGYYPLEDLNLLENRFTILQNRIDEYANSFYWITYQSPKRGELFYHTLEINVRENSNTNNNSRIFKDELLSGDFYGLQEGVYINTMSTDQDGLDSLMNEFPTNQLHFVAITSMATEVPVYEWSSDNDELFTITVDEDFPNQAMINFTGEGDGNVIITDTANNLDKQVYINVTMGGPHPGGAGTEPPEYWRTLRPSMQLE